MVYMCEYGNMVHTVHCPGGDCAAGDAGLLRAVMAAAAGDPSLGCGVCVCVCVCVCVMAAAAGDPSQFVCVCVCVCAVMAAAAGDPSQFVCVCVCVCAVMAAAAGDPSLGCGVCVCVCVCVCASWLQRQVTHPNSFRRAWVVREYGVSQNTPHSCPAPFI
jgi:hypothetical protein